MKANHTLQSPPWLGLKGPGYPTVLSSRARLARNLDGMPFPPASSEGEREKARGIVLEGVSRGIAGDRDWDVRFAEEFSRDELQYLAEEHLLSPSFGNQASGRAVAISWRDGREITVNEEDHVRIQAVLPGAQLHRAWEEADGLDSLLEKEIQYCFDQKLGYLTACPSNVGTGLRVSAMLHLPALVTTGEIAKTISALGQAGMYVRGLFGEGSGVAGNLLQVSNRQTLGLTEESSISRLDAVVSRIVDNERTARKVMLRDSRLEVEDKVYRALGVIERARRMYFFEALELLSLVKLGVEIEVLPVREFNIMEVGVAACPFHVRLHTDEDATDDDIDRERPVLLRRLLGL